MKTKKGVIGILTGGGDVPGLNPAIRAVTIRALREGCEVIGIRRGWAGLVDGPTLVPCSPMPVVAGLMAAASVGCAGSGSPS